jgi:hypothetical protein
MHSLPIEKKDMQIAAGRQGVWRFHVDFPNIERRKNKNTRRISKAKKRCQLEESQEVNGPAQNTPRTVQHPR